MATKSCDHNEHILCDGGACFRCGWNPKVAAERKAKIFGGIRNKDEEEKLNDADRDLQPDAGAAAPAD